MLRSSIFTGPLWSIIRGRRLDRAGFLTSLVQTVQRKGFDTRVMAETTAHGAITQAPHSHRWGLYDLASGATASSEGAQPVCRLPLAAFRLSTSDFSSRRPAAVIQYDDQGSGAPPPSKPFIGASDDHGGSHTSSSNATRLWVVFVRGVTQETTST